MRHYHDMLIAAAAGLALCLAAPAEAAKEGKKKSAQAAHSTKHRTAAARQRDQLGVPAGPIYNGQDYLGDDPDPNIRSQILRDHGRYGTD
jgi:hypothetical protein